MDDHCSGKTRSSSVMARKHAHKVGLDILLFDLSISSHRRQKGPNALTHLKHQQEDQPIVNNHSPDQTQLSGARAGRPVGRGQSLFRPDSIERCDGT